MWKNILKTWFEIQRDNIAAIALLKDNFKFTFRILKAIHSVP